MARTLLLMRDEFADDVDDDTLIRALTNTSVALVADSDNIVSHSAQTAFVTSALLMARSGHRVHLLCPDVPLAGAQPPLAQGPMVTQLAQIGADLLPGIAFITGSPSAEVDLAIALGDSKIQIPARRCIRLNAEPWSGSIAPAEKAARWKADRWPLGGMAAAALVATEAFKIAMKKLERFARNPARMVTVFAETSDLELTLAPPETPICNQLGFFDCISGGAIINAVLYVLARIPDVTGQTRVIEPERSDLSNLNRYMLLIYAHLGTLKAEDLAVMGEATGLTIEPVNERYEEGKFDAIQLAASVLAGVDDIPSRWLIQRANPKWLAIGATTHWSAMASFHQRGLGCAECLHPIDDPSDAPIPTVAFVSFWAGLLTATYFLRNRAGHRPRNNEQQVYLTPFRAENVVRSSVPMRSGCPTCKAILASR